MMNSFRLRSRRQDKNTRSPHNEYRESTGMPNLVPTHSGSSSSHSSPTHLSHSASPSPSRSSHGATFSPSTVGSGRMDRQFNKQIKEDDSFILRGAEALRRQILTNDVDDEPVFGVNKMHPDIRKRHHHFSPSGRPEHDVETHSNGDNWSDPWIEPGTQPVHHRDYTHPVVSTPNSGHAWPEEPEQKASFPNGYGTAFSSSAPGDAADWAQLSDSDKEDGDDDDDTTLMLLPVLQLTPVPPPNAPQPPPETPRSQSRQGGPGPGPAPGRVQVRTQVQTQVQTQEPPAPQTPPRAPGQARNVSPDNTPETYMGRNHSLRAKVHTYLVQNAEDVDGSTLDSSNNESFTPTVHPRAGDKSYLPEKLCCDPPPAELSFSSQNVPPSPSNSAYVNRSILTHLSSSFSTTSSSHTLDLLRDLQDGEAALQELWKETDDDSTYLLEATRNDPNVAMMALPIVEENSPCESVVSPFSMDFAKLKRDPGYRHAQRAGILWQSLASQHVRFPSKWWNGARSPPMGLGERQSWNYLGRHRVGGNRLLNRMIGNRGSSGRLLLHVIVRNTLTLVPVQDIAIGCFHPNARGIRTTTAFDPSLEDYRDIWVALRRRGRERSVIESLLKRRGEAEASESPLGGKHAVSNNNMKAVFGEKPPIQTVYVMESELYELFSNHLGEGGLPPAAVLLQEYLKD